MTARVVTARDGARIHCRDVGSGPAVLCIPAWSMTADAFEHQIAHLSPHYRVVAIDPRGQGRSSTTLEGNDYVTHAHDIADVMETLGLCDVAMMGWSNGALAALHYADRYGPGRMRAFVDIDMPTMSVPRRTGDWGEVPRFSDFRNFLLPLTADPTAFREAMVGFFVKRDVTDDERRWLLAQMHTQSPFVGRLLLSDTLFYDVTDVLVRLSARLPTLVAVRDAWGHKACRWVARACPEARCAVFRGGHMFFWEDPAPFNEMLGNFLGRVYTQ